MHGDHDVAVSCDHTQDKQSLIVSPVCPCCSIVTGECYKELRRYFQMTSFEVLYRQDESPLLLIGF